MESRWVEGWHILDLSTGGAHHRNLKTAAGRCSYDAKHGPAPLHNAARFQFC